MPGRKLEVLLEREGVGTDATMMTVTMLRTHAGVPQQCLGWMNRRGAAPGAARERRGEEKRFNRAKAGLSGAQRHTETGGWSGQRPLSFRRTSA